MKLIKNKEFLRNAANFIDVMNTLGGGVVQPNVAFEERKKGSLIRVQLPTIDPEAFRVILAGNKLTVAAVIRAAEAAAWTAPLFHQEFLLPANIALDRIKVVYKQNELQVRLPYYDSKTRQLPIAFDED